MMNIIADRIDDTGDGSGSRGIRLITEQNSWPSLSVVSPTVCLPGTFRLCMGQEATLKRVLFVGNSYLYPNDSLHNREAYGLRSAGNASLGLSIQIVNRGGSRLAHNAGLAT